MTPASSQGVLPPRYLWAYILSQRVVPAWLLVGAFFKLWERNPSLLPTPVLDVVKFGEGTFGLTGTAWFDFAMRSIVATEVVLALVMILMIRPARLVAIGILSLFCVILAVVIGQLWIRDGFGAVLKGTCGCLGGWSPNPLVMLAIDGTMLIAILRCGYYAFDPAIAWRGAPTMLPWKLGGNRCLVASVVACAVIFLLPKPAAQPVTPDATDSNGNGSAPLPPLATDSWPGLPSVIEQFYVPEFESWVGKGIVLQDFARLIQPVPPADFLKGDWILIFFREDCDHCEALLIERFSGSLPIRTLVVSIPDTDPAAALEMPCSECIRTSMKKEVQYVVGTPIIIRLKDGVVTCVVTDSEDSAKLDGCLAP